MLHEVMLIACLTQMAARSRAPLPYYLKAKGLDKPEDASLQAKLPQLQARSEVHPNPYQTLLPVFSNVVQLLVNMKDLKQCMNRLTL